MKEPIAIIGMGCRLPGSVRDAETFWELLVAGRDAIVRVPRDRWNNRNYYDPNPARPGRIYVDEAGFLEQHPSLFDAAFFGFAPREASRLDPQQRLLLETSWEAFEDAGLPPSALAGTNTGVFVGGFMTDSQLLQSGDKGSDWVDLHTTTGMGLTMLSARLSHFFDLKGPCMTIDTACSSSLVAVHYACASLWSGEASLALAGGVNSMTIPNPMVGLCKGRFLSPDARCKAFDATANGYARGEGAGIVVLKLLSRALEDGDPIHAVIRGSAVNQDGHTNGITVPDQAAQEAVAREACRRAGIDPSDVGYIEAHGTGTAVGDPVEAGAMSAVFGRGRREPCVMSSVKTNVGHLEAGAGITGLLKAALCLERASIPPHLHFKKANPAIDFDRIGLRIPLAHEPWPSGRTARLAAVNSFGYGGTNAHVVMEEPPRPAYSRTSHVPEREQLLLLSARSEAAVRALASSYATQIKEYAEPPSLHALCSSAATRRDHHSHRAAIVASDYAELIHGLETLARPDGSAVSTTRNAPRLVFVYTGMGPQWWRMGRDLYATEPVFRGAIDRCDAERRKHSPVSLRDELLAEQASSRMHETALGQCANFALQVALTELFGSWGLSPDVMVGHSAGEVAAAYLAGAIEFDQAVRASYYRGTLQQRMAGQGTMLATGLREDEARELLKGRQARVSLAALSGPSAVTLSGDRAALEEIAAILASREVFAKFMRVDVAFHSHQLEPLRDELLAALSGIRSHRPTTELVSTVTGERVGAGDLSADYWWRNLRQPVRFTDAMRTLAKHENAIHVEIGPHPVLAAGIKESLSAAGRDESAVVCSSLIREKPERRSLLETLSKVYAAGRNPNWKLHFGAAAEYVRLPTYPWQRETHWFESTESLEMRKGGSTHPLVGPKILAPTPTWECELIGPSCAFLADHRVEGAQVFPGAGYVELAIAALSASSGSFTLEDVRFQKALVIGENDATVLRLEAGDNTFEIHSRKRGEEPRFTLHASGRFLREPLSTLKPRVIVAEVRGRMVETSAESAYARLEARGLDYGPSFRGMTRLWVGTDEVLANIEGPPSISDDALAPYALHPALLDACFQSLMACIPETGTALDRAPFVPVRIEQVRLHARPGRQFFCHGIKKRSAADFVEGDVVIFDDEGRVTVELFGVRAQAIGAAELMRTSAAMDDWFYESTWIDRPSADAESEIVIDSPRSWLLMGGTPEVARALASELCASGGTVHRARFGDAVEVREDVSQIRS